MRKRLGGEDGQALLIALAFLLLFGVVIAVVLGFAEASVRATMNLREQRSVAYAADGAMDGAIAYAASPAGRADGVGYFGRVPCISYSVVLNGETATVTCESVGNPLSENRRVRFTASVDGIPRVSADVFFPAGGGAPTVLSWTYLR